MKNYLNRDYYIFYATGFKIKIFTRREGKDSTCRTSLTDNALKIFILKSVPNFSGLWVRCMAIESGKMIAVENLQFSGLENVDEFIMLADEARSFLISHKWCESIKEDMFDRGWGYILAVFYFSFESTFMPKNRSIQVKVSYRPGTYQRHLSRTISRKTAAT